MSIRNLGGYADGCLEKILPAFGQDLTNLEELFSRLVVNPREGFMIFCGS